MFLEMHVIQNFSLSNLNRDDTGAPKTCDFGGVRRARISSQCLKRAMRTYFRDEELLPPADLGHRTKLLKRALVERMAKIVSDDQAEVLASTAITHLGFGLKKDKTEYLLFVGSRELDVLAAFILEHREALAKAEGSGKLDKELQARIPKVLDGGGAVDLALFGRMIADKPGKNVDAAVQVAHAFSTHAVATEFDFYSAVDDLQREDDEAGAGAGMLGTTLYNSSCYYRYANLDAEQLAVNLGQYSNRAKEAVGAFLKGAIHAVPTGKQTGSAAQNPPALVMITVREKGLWSLANAFVKPIRARADQDVVLLSAEAMVDHFTRLSALYGTEGVRYAGIASYLDLTHPRLPVETAGSMGDLVDRSADVLAAGQEWA